MKEHEDLDRALSDITFRATELARHTNDLKVRAAEGDPNAAWRFAYRTEDELRQLALRLRDASQLLLDGRVQALYTANVGPLEAGEFTRTILKTYLGCAGAFYEAVYAWLGDTILTEDEPEAANIVELISARLSDVESQTASQQEKEVLILDLISSALAFRANPGPACQRAFVDAVKSLLVARLEKTSTILELLNQLAAD